MRTIYSGVKLGGFNPNTDKFEIGTIVENHITVTVKDLTVSVNTFELVNKNGDLLTNIDVQKVNSIIVSDAYKRKTGLLTSNEVKEIRIKRGWSQEKFSRFLNLGLKDIARYENGAIQTKLIDDVMRVIRDDEGYQNYIRVLNKDEYKKIIDQKMLSDVLIALQQQVENYFGPKKSYQTDMEGLMNGDKRNSIAA